MMCLLSYFAHRMLWRVWHVRNPLPLFTIYQGAGCTHDPVGGEHKKRTNKIEQTQKEQTDSCQGRGWADGINQRKQQLTDTGGVGTPRGRARGRQRGWRGAPWWWKETCMRWWTHIHKPHLDTAPVNMFFKRIDFLVPTTHEFLLIYFKFSL